MAADLAAIARAKARARNDDELPQLVREELLKLGPLGDKPSPSERLAMKREQNRTYQRMRRLAAKTAKARKAQEG